MNEDSELLRGFVIEGSSEAFTRLVERHCNLVWCAAYRILGDADLARDVAQTTFATLARKAGQLAPNVVLAGWLYQTSRLSATMMVRTNARRAVREEHAMQLQELSRSKPDETKTVEELQPLLDAALGELEELDRTAIVLRFLSGRSLAEVAATLGGSEDAARMRVSRALEKLRDSFRRRGGEVSLGVLAAALGMAGSQAAPVVLAAALASGALTTATLPSTVSVPILMKSKTILALAQSKLVIGLVAAAMAGGLVWQKQELQKTQSENTTLQRQLAEQPPPPPASSPDALDAGEIKRLREEHLELMRLRGEYPQWQQRFASSSMEVGRLQKELAAARQDAALQRDAFARANPKLVEMTHALECIHNLVQINQAKEQWALEHKQVTGAIPQDSDLFGELRPLAAKTQNPPDSSLTKPTGDRVADHRNPQDPDLSRKTRYGFITPRNPGDFDPPSGPRHYIAAKPVCPDGGVYTLNSIAEAPTCSVSGHTLP